MDIYQYQQYFYNVKSKIEQALRLQLKLEEKSQALLMVLDNLDDLNKIEPNLRELRDLRKRKLRILDICDKGLQDAKENFTQYERQIKSSEGLSTQIKIKIPLLISAEDYESQILWALHTVFSGINLQIKYASDVSIELKNIVNEEYTIIDNMLRRIQLGAFDFPEYRKLLDRLSWLRNAEKDLIEGIKKRNNPDKMSRIFFRMKDLQKRIQVIAEKHPVKQILVDALRKHPMLATIQAVWAPMPDFTIGSGFVAYYFGVVYLPAFLALCYIAEWSPSWIAILIEINKYKKSKK